MKIGQVIASRGEGGLEKHVRELCVALAGQGHQVDLIGDARFISTLPSAVGKRAAPMHLSRRHPWLLYRLYRELLAGDYDIIHAQASKAAALVNSLRPVVKTPAVATLHNIKRSVMAFQGFDQIITVSRQLAQSFPPDDVSVVYNGIESSSSAPVDLATLCPVPGGQPVVLAVGRLVTAKGFDILLEAIAGLPVTLLIAGEGPERARLETMSRRLPAPTRCWLLGQQSNIAGLMQAADAVVISSRREGFSYVFNEALASGACVLASDVPVANEVLPPELIVPVGDARALGDRLAHLLAHPGLWSERMAEPRRVAQQEMTLAAMTRKTLRVYDQVLSRRR